MDSLSVFDKSGRPDNFEPLLKRQHLETADNNETANVETDSSLLADLPERLDDAELEKILAMGDKVSPQELVMDIMGVRRCVVQLDKAIQKNQTLRLKYSDEPEKFLTSEVQLDEAIQKCKPLGADAALLKEFAMVNGMSLLVSQLAHVNTDVAISVLDALVELTDTTQVMELESPREFVEEILRIGLVPLVMEFFGRIDERASEEDYNAITNAMQVLDNFIETDPQMVCDTVTEHPKLILWLLQRMRQGDDVFSDDYNRVFASEILCIILQTSPEARKITGKRSAEKGLDGIDKLLRMAAVYRKRDPSSTNEEEFAANVFNAMCTLMVIPSNCDYFGRAQGIDLMVRILRERRITYPHALRLTTFALQSSRNNNQIFIDKLGLRPLFGLLMRKGVRSKKHSKEEREEEELLCSLLTCLLKNLSGDSQIRVAAKFLENKGEKANRLLDLHQKYYAAVKAAEEETDRGVIQDLSAEERNERLFLQRCDRGLFTLQRVNMVLLRLVNVGNALLTSVMLSLFKFRGIDFAEMYEVVSEYIEQLPEEGTDKDESRAVVQHLMEGFIDAVSRLPTSAGKK